MTQFDFSESNQLYYLRAHAGRDDGVLADGRVQRVLVGKVGGSGRRRDCLALGADSIEKFLLEFRLDSLH